MNLAQFGDEIHRRGAEDAEKINSLLKVFLCDLCASAVKILSLNLASLSRYALALLFCAVTVADDWPSYGRDPGGTRSSPLKQIDRTNVARLQRAWTYRTGEIELGLGRDARPGAQLTAFQCTPLVIDGVLYLSTPSNRVIALDAETGREIWKFDPQQGAARRRFRQHRGVAYWENGRERRILHATQEARLYSLDARTGRPDPAFGEDGAVNLRATVAEKWPKAAYGNTSPPTIYKDLVIVGAAVPEGPSHGPSGAVRAFDVRTGRLVWRFNTVPQPGEIGHDTWEADSWRDRTGVNVWSIMSVDERRGIVFLPMGSAAYDFYGADRKGQNLFANSVVALDAATGRRLWHFQTTHHDIWDYDLPAQPVLAAVRQNGRVIDAVAQVTKMGFVFVLDRQTGRPLFPVEERPVAASEAPGEATWPTQPFPLKPPPLSRQTAITRDDVQTEFPESRDYCLELFDSSVSRGIYTPLGLKSTIIFPGTLGGANWSGASFDPGLGYLFVNANELSMLGEMRKQPEGSSMPWRRGSRMGEYARFQDEKKRPCQKPPWGTLTAINLNTGEFAWRVPLGIVEDLAAQGIADTGTLNLGGSIVTAGGVVFIGATNDSRFRAFDARTGRELWQAKLEAGGHATPVTYWGKKTRKQYVVIAAGGGGYFSDRISDVVAAYALP